MSDGKRHAAGLTTSGSVIVSSGAPHDVEARLLAGLARPLPSTRDECADSLRALLPVIVPSQYAQLEMPIVFHALPHPHMQLAWLVDGDDGDVQTGSWVNEDLASCFQAHGFADWRAHGVANLARSPHGVMTHEKRRPDGSCVWLASMQRDALGSSRVMLAPVWEDLFPEGYSVALPDRSCGMVISAHLSAVERQEIDDMVASMCATATTPMFSCVFSAADVAIPRDWIPRYAGMQKR